VFDRKAMSRTMAQTVPVIPSTLGPTPFSSMSSAAALAMTSALNRTQPVAGWYLSVFCTLIENQ